MRGDSRFPAGEVLELSERALLAPPVGFLCLDGRVDAYRRLAALGTDRGSVGWSAET